MIRSASITAVALALLLAACGDGTDGEPTATATPTAAAVDDVRVPIPTLPEGGLQFVTPDLEIPAYSERQYCFFVTYDGPDVGVARADFWQDGSFGHHAIAMISNADPEVYPDGSLHDCTSSESLPMTDLEPLVIPNGTAAQTGDDGHSVMELPPGFATKLRAGTRLVIQSHYLNTSGRQLLARDVIDFELMPLEDVQEWVATYAHTETDLVLQPLQETTVTVNCTWDDDVYLLVVTGHMHEWGTAFSLEHKHLDGTRERIYAVDTWDVGMRDSPPIGRYAEGEYLVRAGESFITTCTWFNDTDHVIEFPEEMCATAGIAYPSVVPIICEQD